MCAALAARGLALTFRRPRSGMPALADLFTGKDQAASYAEFRPTYPPELYEKILAFADEPQARDRALDIATGSGQAAVELAHRYRQVVAIDVSSAQLDAAIKQDNIKYEVGTAESTGQPSASFDLVTTAQALHWFDLDKFYTEVRRVLKPHGTLAAWGYKLCTFDDNARANDALFAYYDGKLGPYWSDRRKLVEQGYEGLEPTRKHFGTVKRDEVVLRKSMTIAGFAGYLRSWSAYATYRKAQPDAPDPIPAFIAQLMEAHGHTDEQQQVKLCIPIFMILAKQPAPLA